MEIKIYQLKGQEIFCIEVNKNMLFLIIWLSIKAIHVAEVGAVGSATPKMYGSSFTFLDVPAGITRCHLNPAAITQRLKSVLPDIGEIIMKNRSLVKTFIIV